MAVLNHRFFSYVKAMFDGAKDTPKEGGGTIRSSD